jgi:hypothetical protein
MWGKVDHLRGLKENVIMGRLVPAGTGMARYRRIGIQVEAPEGMLEGPEEESMLEAGLPAPEASTPAEGLMAGPVGSNEQIDG